MRLRFTLAVLALLFASFGVAQDTVQLVHNLPELHVGTLDELDDHYLVLRASGEGKEAKLFPRDSVALVRFGDGRLYVYTAGRPTRVTREEIAPATELRVQNGFFGDRFRDGTFEIPRAAFEYKLRGSSAEDQRKFRKSRGFRQAAKVLAIPAVLMAGLTTYVVLQSDLEIRPGFALATAAVVGSALGFGKGGTIAQERSLARINAAL